MASKTVKSLIRSKIRKLEQLERLLDDPDVVSLLSELQIAGLSGKQMRLPVKPAKQRAGRKPGPLSEKTLKVVINAMREVSAKDVLAILDAEGVSIKGKDKAVTVSKILRQLAKAGKVSARPSSPKKKAPILYQSNALAQSFPVQEEVTH